MRDLLTTPAETIEADLETLHVTMSNSPVFDTQNEPDATVYWSHLPLAMCNVIVNAHIAPPQVKRRVPQLLGPFLQRGRPFQWITTPETTNPALEAALAQAGLRPEESPAMHVTLGEAIDPGTPDDIYIDVAWPDHVGPVSSTIFAGFNFPPGTEAEHLHFLDTMDPADNQFFIARSLVTGDAIGASTMHRRADSVMLANLTTLPAARGRGVGRALTATMMNRAATTGARTATLVAHESRYPLFIDLGFRTRFNVVTWIWEPTD